MHTGLIALVAVATLGSPEAEANALIDKLATCASLTDRSCLVAAARLGQLKEAAIPPLSRRFADLPREPQVLALGVIAGVPTRPAGDLLATLAANRRLDPAVRALALDDLSPRHHPKGIALFVRTATDKAPIVRVASARALANHLYAQDRRILPALLRLARDAEAPVRLEAVFGLGFSADKRAGKPLLTATRDAALDVRRAAVEGLGLVKHAPAVGPLVDLLEDEDELLAKAALRALKFQTDEDLGENPARWRRWLEERRPRR